MSDFEIFREAAADRGDQSGIQPEAGQRHRTDPTAYLEEGIALAHPEQMARQATTAWICSGKCSLTTGTGQGQRSRMRPVSRAEEVLYMATAAGAQCMGLADCDSLAVGKKADIIMIDLMQPEYAAGK